MLKIIQKLKEIWNAPNVIANNQRHINNLAEGYSELNKLIQERTRVHADIHFMEGLHNIVLIGRYRNEDYVRLFSVESRSFVDLVDLLTRMEKDAKIGRFDRPGRFPSVSAVIGRDRF